MKKIIGMTLVDNMSSYWPRFSRDWTNSVAPNYLEGIFLDSEKDHNLSFSGMQYDWQLDKLLGDSITELGKPHQRYY